MQKLNDYYVYFHKNPITDEIFYIGIGKNRRCYNFEGRNKYYRNYIKKYGKPNIEIIQSNLTRDEAIENEKSFIKKYGRKCYDENGILTNMSSGGEIGSTGTKHTQEWKSNQSIIMKQVYEDNSSLKTNHSLFMIENHKSNPSHKLAIGQAQIGRIKSEDEIIKIKEGLKNTKDQRIEKLKISLNKPEVKLTRGKKISEGNVSIVIQLDLEGNFIKEWLNPSIAAKELKINYSALWDCLKGRNKQSGGYKWKYK